MIDPDLGGSDVPSGGDHRSIYDSLTGLPNHALFCARLEEASVRAAADGTLLAVVLLNIDGFRNVNDAADWSVGDELLLGVARRLASAVRAGDELARFGGDDFAVLATGLHGESDAIAIAEGVRRALDEPVELRNRWTAVRVSVGVAVDAAPRRTAQESLIRDATVALFRAKQRGGGRSELFESGMRRRQLSAVLAEDELRGALERDELSLAFRPVIDLQTGAIASLEALPRWEHPGRGVVLPSDFLDTADSSALGPAIGSRVIAGVCRQIAEWGEYPDLTVPVVSIKIPIIQLMEPEFLDDLTAALRVSGVPPERITLELEAGALLRSDPAPAVALALKGLRQLGVPIALDNFGTPWSPPDQLERVPVTGLKIDRALIGGLADGDVASPMVRAIVALGAGLDLSVVAAGIDTPALAQAASSLGCRLAQGPLFGHPVAAQDVAGMLRTGPPRSTMPYVRWTRPLDGESSERRPNAERGQPHFTVAVAEAAVALGVSASTLRRWSDDGRLRVIRTPGGHRRFLEEDVRRIKLEAAGATPPILRAARLPEEPIADLVALLAEEGKPILRRAVVFLYEAGHPGWFGSEAGTGWLDGWLAALELAAAGASSWEALIDATNDLAASARVAGTGPSEGYLLFELVGDLVLRRLRERGTHVDSLSATRRILRAVGREMVDAR